MPAGGSDAHSVRQPNKTVLKHAEYGDMRSLIRSVQYAAASSAACAAADGMMYEAADGRTGDRLPRGALLRRDGEVCPARSRQFPFQDGCRRESQISATGAGKGQKESVCG